MNPKEYVQGAIRTEAPVTDELKARLRNARTASVLCSRLAMAIYQGNTIDELKKHIFYGKPALWDLANKDTIAPGVQDRLTNDKTIRLLHGAMTLVTESVELIEALTKHIFDGDNLDEINLIEEIGDAFWGLAVMADALPASFETIMERNNTKLRIRYPEKFSEGAAQTRDLGRERRALAGKAGANVMFEAPTMTGLTCKIYHIDLEHGYIHGYLEGGAEATWGLNDGTLISPNRGNSKQFLDKAAFNEAYRKYIAANGGTPLEGAK